MPFFAPVAPATGSPARHVRAACGSAAPACGAASVLAPQRRRPRCHTTGPGTTPHRGRPPPRRARTGGWRHRPTRCATGRPQRPGRGQAGRGEQRRLDPADLGAHQLTEKPQALAAQEQRPRILLVLARRMRVPLRAVPNAQAAIRQRPLENGPDQGDVALHGVGVMVVRISEHGLLPLPVGCASRARHPGPWMVARGGPAACVRHSSMRGRRGGRPGPYGSRRRRGASSGHVFR